MPFAQTAYLAMVIVAFSSFGLALGVVSLWSGGGSKAKLVDPPQSR
jgi:hypothetical protein